MMCSAEKLFRHLLYFLGTGEDRGTNGSIYKSAKLCIGIRWQIYTKWGYNFVAVVEIK